MDKKGFTLVELLATITILVLMSLIIGVNVTSILRSTEDNEYKFDKEQIEKAACVFADSEVRKDETLKNEYSKDYTNLCGGTSCTVAVVDLVKSGLLSKNYIDDNKPESEFKNKSVTVTYTGGEKKCTCAE